ncbi:MAG: ral L-amino acid transport system substrate-binding protein, partial [Thermodesulfobacteriota bacterium]|nr:ral L-amino acid transport system substrate-binding protein [Thermodesulfobacteriota bacterium]
MMGHNTRLISGAFLAWLAVAGVIVMAEAVWGGDVLDRVKARGRLHCGVGENMPGFSERDANGSWSGFNVDFCRAVAAAVLGDGDKVKFVPLTTSMRFPALQAGKIDLLVRNTTWTLEREAFLKVQFPAVLFYDSQAFLVPSKSGITSLAELSGATVCVEKGTTSLQNMKDYFVARGLSVNPMVLDTTSEAAAAFFEGRCSACTGDSSELASVRAQAPGGIQAFKIVPDRISKEPLCPVVWGGDREWATIIRWVVYALILAEEHGITRENADSITSHNDVRVLRMQKGEHSKLAKAMGVPTDWAVRAVKAAGNYGEMFERNLGSGSPLNMERGLN